MTAVLFGCFELSTPHDLEQTQKKQIGAIMANSNQLVYKTVDNQAVTTSLAIAQALDYSHKSVIQLIRNHEADLNAFDQRVTFQMLPFATTGGTQTKTVAILNEQQATLLVCFMKNTEKVRKFKVALVKAFYEMKKALNSVQLEKVKTQVLEDFKNHEYRKFSSSWYEKQIDEVVENSNLTLCEIDDLKDIARRSYGQGYAIAMSKNEHKEEKKDGLYLTQAQADSLKLLLHYRNLFKDRIKKASEILSMLEEGHFSSVLFDSVSEPCSIFRLNALFDN